MGPKQSNSSDFYIKFGPGVYTVMRIITLTARHPRRSAIILYCVVDCGRDFLWCSDLVDLLSFHHAS